MLKTNIVQRPSPNTRQQPTVEFRLNDYESAIWLKGYDVIIESMLRCPCKGNQTANLSNCPNCQGTGYVFINPYETKVILHSMNYDTKYKEWSEENIGTVSITSMSRDDIKFMDRITVKDSEATMSEVKQLKEYSGVKYFYTIYNILSIIDVFTFDDSNSPLRKLIENIDYRFERNKIIILSNEEIGKSFTVRYKHNLQYHVIDLIHNIRSSTKKAGDGNLVSEKYPVNARGRLAHYNIEAYNFEGNNIFDNSYQ